jgi:hypothetical protein
MSNYSFTFGSRYGDRRTAELIEHDDKEVIFRVSGMSRYVRGAEQYFDFEGGPDYGQGYDFHGRGEVLAVHPAPALDLPEGHAACYVTVRLNKDAKKDIAKWKKNQGAVEQLKQEIGEWLDNGL